MSKILIAYHTRSGATRRLAEAVAEGASSVASAEVTVQPVGEVEIDQLTDYDAIALGSPTYYGTMASEVKKFLDDSVAVHGRLAGKVGAAFATSALIGGGNETTILSMLQGLLIHGMIIQGNARGDHYGPVGVGSIDDRARDGGQKLGRSLAELTARLFD